METCCYRSFLNFTHTVLMELPNSSEMILQLEQNMLANKKSQCQEWIISEKEMVVSQ